MMNTQNNNIDVFAMTDSHQEARKLCCLFSGIIRRAQNNGKNTLICDGGDLFKGIYDRNLSVDAYIKLRQHLPEAKIVLALGNNDFGFNSEQLNFLIKTCGIFNKNNIHVLCANLRDLNSGKYPKWADPYILLEINHKKVMVTAFCVNYIRLQKYGLNLIDINTAFAELKDTIKHINPDVFIILNHALEPSSISLAEDAENYGINLDLLIGGHEHTYLEPIKEKRIYYPHAFSRTMLHFQLNCSQKPTELHFVEEINCKDECLLDFFEPPIKDFEEKSGLNTPIARSTLDLSRNYSAPCPLGSFVADQMKIAGRAKLGVISTGYMTHALRYEKDKILTNYNIERAFFAESPVQTVEINADKLKDVFNNAIRNRYIQKTGNTRFLQCSHNLTLVCKRDENNFGQIKQIYINDVPLLNDEGKALHPEEFIVCAVDPFIASGELGFDAFKALSKETLMKNNQLVRIKDLFIQAVKEAENKYPEGSSYPYFKIIDED